MQNDHVPEVPLALVSNSYLEAKIVAIRQTPILWEGYERAQLLDHSQLELIKKIDKKSPEDIKSALQGREDAYASLISHLLKNLTRADTKKYVCILADDVLSAGDVYARTFCNSSILDPFLQFLSSDDEFMALQASKLLTILACSAPEPESLELSKLYQWITQTLVSQQNELIELALQELESLLRVREYRLPLWNTPSAVKNLVELLDKSASPQRQYQVVFCLWLLTFETEIASEINEKYDIIPLLVSLAKAAVKEKVIRVSIATLKNLVEKAPSQNLAAMLVVKVLPFTENLSSRKWSDADILEDVDYLKGRLQENFQSLTTFEQYASEVETGKLEWSPPHESELFWKENASKLEENDFQLLRAIARILSTSTVPLVLSVASNDIGQYVKYASPNGKRRLQDIGAKQRIMELMTHEDHDVRYQALSAVQKLMHQAW